MPRGRSRYATPGPRAGSVLLDTGRGSRPRRRRRRRGRGGGGGWDPVVRWPFWVGGLAGEGGGGNRLLRGLFALAIVGAIGAGASLGRAREDAIDARHTAAQRFAAA